MNGLDYFVRIGKKDDPRVLELISRIRSEPVWNRLLDEEKDFIDKM